MDNLSRHIKNLGVKSIYFCSGSRNHSLIENFSSFNLEFHFDERVTSFMALGEAKQTKIPVAICTTSGTAVAECLPAVIEAYYSNVKLIIISADRPDRLRDTHAPQAINQLNIFSDFVRTKYNGPISSYKEVDTIYPYHINIEIDDAKESVESSDIINLSEKELLSQIAKFNHPLVIFTEDEQDNTKYYEFFSKLGYYISIECTSNIKSTSVNDIKYDSTLIELVRSKKIDGIIKFGKTPITKLWRILDNSISDIPIICLNQKQTGLSYGFISQSPEHLLSSDLHRLSNEYPKEKDILEFRHKLPLSEFSIFEEILDTIKPESTIFLGNSMAVRYGQLLRRNDFDYYAMRGANGIDGQISTALGFAKSLTQDVHLIIGDLTFLYDLNALILDWPKNLFVHVLNNRGGRIFERINLHGSVINEHDLNLNEIVKGFGLKNIKIHNIDNEQTKEYWELIE